jgi:tetratricopeptide (TPR) repeat protein
MVKFRGKPRKKQGPHVAGETGVVETYSAPDRISLLAPFRSLSKKSKIFIGLLAGLAVVVLVVSLVPHANPYKGYEVVDTSGDKAPYQNAIDAIKATAPKDSASTAEKTAYYDRLAITYANAEDYKNAVKAFEARRAVSDEGLDYLDYIAAAQYYHAINDDTTALVLLKNAKAILPERDNFDAGYSRANVTKAMRELTKEYSS